MKLLKFTIVIFFPLLFISCVKGNSSTTNSLKTDSVQNNLQISKIQNVEVKIEGMTCEIGCAKLIESKTHKLEGMTFVNVSFEHGIGQFTFDSNKLTISDIEQHINGIAGGELYKVTSRTEVDEFTILEKKEGDSE